MKVLVSVIIIMVNVLKKWKRKENSTDPDVI